MDITVLIKTFERPKSCAALLTSVRQFYPDIPIVLVDDSKTPFRATGEHVTSIHLPFDSGVSKGRNAGVEKVQTRYTFLCDDDCVFTRDTDLNHLQKLLEESGVDILGIRASGVNYSGTYRIEGDTIYCDRGANAQGLYDFVPNIFLAKTETLRQFKWDEELKIGEHFAYFFEHQGKLKIGYTEDVSVIHDHQLTEDYSRYRNRAFDYVKSYLRSKGYKRRVDWHGTIEA